MTVLEEELSSHSGGEAHHDEQPRGMLLWLTSTDHKIIGKNYMYTSLLFFVIAGAMAMLIRTQLFSPNNHCQ